MNINQYTGFIRWTFKSLFKNIAYKHNQYRILMDREFWLAFILWFLFTAIIIIPVGVTAVYFFEPGSGYVQTVIRIYLGIAIAYFAGTGVSIMYENYRDEQERIIQELARTQR